MKSIQKDLLSFPLAKFPVKPYAFADNLFKTIELENVNNPFELHQKIQNIACNSQNKPKSNQFCRINKLVGISQEKQKDIQKKNLLEIQKQRQQLTNSLTWQFQQLSKEDQSQQSVEYLVNKQEKQYLNLQQKQKDFYRKETQVKQRKLPKLQTTQPVSGYSSIKKQKVETHNSIQCDLSDLLQIRK